MRLRLNGIESRRRALMRTLAYMTVFLMVFVVGRASAASMLDAGRQMLMQNLAEDQQQVDEDEQQLEQDEQNGDDEAAEQDEDQLEQDEDQQDQDEQELADQ